MSGPASLPYNPRSRYDIVKDSVHGYIRFTHAALTPGETTEKDLIDSPWVQRLRRIRQLQAAWYVYPSADHSRFVHSLSVMELAGRFAKQVYTPYWEAQGGSGSGYPSPALVVSTLRIAGLLHDVGHGPFTHLLDDAFLKPKFGLTHENLSAWIVTSRLADLIRGIRRTPDGESLAEGESVDPNVVCYLITNEAPRNIDPVWKALAPIVSGCYDADKMDFLLRDGSACGQQGIAASEVTRLMITSFLGSTHDGFPVLMLDSSSEPTLYAFLRQRQYLFETVYHHRTVRALEKTITVPVVRSVESVIGVGVDPRCDAYLGCDEAAIQVELSRNARPDDPGNQEAAELWMLAALRRVPWKSVLRYRKLEEPDLPEARRLNASLIMQVLAGRARDRGVRDANSLIMVDVIVNEAPRDLLSVYFHDRGRSGCFNPRKENLKDDGIFRLFTICNVYVRSDIPPEAVRIISDEAHKYFSPLDRSAQLTSY